MTVRILQGDCRDVLKTLPDESVHCVVTSPPYWGLRDYGVPGQLGLERDPAAYVMDLTDILDTVRRVLRADGTLWLNLGDSYSGSGKGGNPDAGKQATNKGSQSIGTLYGKTGETARQAALTNYSRRLNAEQGIAAKQLLGIPWRVALALQDRGWWLRQDIIWAKPNPMPESVTDRCTKAHEYIFLLAKSERYYFDAAAIAEPSVTGDERKPYAPGQVDYRGNGHDRGGGTIRTAGKHSTMPKDSAGHRIVENVARARGEGADHDNPFGTTRNKRSVWTVPTQGYAEAHFATFPPDLIEPCILAGCPEGGTVLDPFGGAGTTGLVADRHHRNAILIELNPEYVEMARKRIFNDAPLFAEVS